MPARETDQVDCDLLCQHAQHAGKIAMEWFGNDPEVWWKEGDSPVSEADYAVDSYLQEVLCKARPDYGWLSEETEDNPARLNRARTFVVDPIDGTRGFINRMNEWCIAIAVVEDLRPVAAVLHAPVLGKTVHATLDGGAFVDGMPTQARQHAQPLRMTGPRSVLTALDKSSPIEMEKHKFIPSLAWRLAKVAMSELDLALARGSARDWDLAAADLIVHEAGACLTDLDGGLLSYNCQSTRQGAIVASHPVRHQNMLELAKREFKI